MPVESPCISVCAIDETSGYCKGCWRSVDEVASWLYMDDGEKLQVIAKLEQRKIAHRPDDTL